MMLFFQFLKQGMFNSFDFSDLQNDIGKLLFKSIFSCKTPTSSWYKRLVPSQRETKVCCATAMTPVVVVHGANPGIALRLDLWHPWQGVNTGPPVWIPLPGVLGIC